MSELWLAKTIYSTPRGHHSKQVLDRPATDAEKLDAVAAIDGVIVVPQELQGVSRSMASGETEFTIWMDDPAYQLLGRMEDEVEYEIWLIPKGESV